MKYAKFLLLRVFLPWVLLILVHISAVYGAGAHLLDLQDVYTLFRFVESVAGALLLWRCLA